jgi:hypothetical protein
MYVTCIQLSLLAKPWLNITPFIKFISSTTNCVSSIEMYLIENLCSQRQSFRYLHKFPDKFSKVWRNCTRKGKCNFLIRFCRRYILAWYIFVACKRMHDTLHTMELRSPRVVLGLIRTCAAIEIFGMVGKIHTPVTLDSTAVRKWPPYWKKRENSFVLEEVRPLHSVCPKIFIAWIRSELLNATSLKKIRKNN